MADIKTDKSFKSSVDCAYHTPRTWSDVCSAQELREANRHAFTAPDLWPPNSRDLNPVDYKIWGNNLAMSLPDKRGGCA